MDQTTILGNYMPNPADVPQDRILACRKVCETNQAAWWPDLDTRPGSVFGDLQLTPFSVLMASADIAIQRIVSDLNPSNLAQGIVFNPTFAASYLANFGVTPAAATYTTGLVCLRFTTDKTYVLDSGTSLLFGSVIYNFGSGEGSPIIIYPTGTTNQRRVLVKTGVNEFSVYIPVFGVAGGSVSDGDSATYALAINELTGVVAAGDFDPGSLAETVPALARRIRNAFYSATLTTRSGVISFLNWKYPNLVGASAVLTGDSEMLRDGTNPLGINEGKVDVHVRSRLSYLTGQQVVTMTYDPVRGGWVGCLSTPVPPAFIFSVDNFDPTIPNNAISTVYAKSTDEMSDTPGVAFSKKELLGLVAQVSTANPANIQTQSIGPVVNVGNSPVTLSVTGEYAGYVFDNQTIRSISLKYAGIGPATHGTAAVFMATDSRTGQTALVSFAPTAIGSTTAVADNTTYAYSTMFNGLVLTLTSSGAFDATSLANAIFNVAFQGKTCDFIVSYRYDPATIIVDSLVGDADNKPAGVDVLAKTFIPCHITKFNVNYRAPFGTTVGTAAAQTQIFNYLNSIIYPNIYEESTISQIMLANGATGVSSIGKKGVFYPSLANAYVESDGTQIAIVHPTTTTLRPDPNNYGYGDRNVGYMVELNTITFNASTF